MSLRIILLLLIFFHVAVISSRAQYTNLKFENLSTTEGLSSSTCMELFQDSDGFLWFGTIDGLNRYDGYEFTVFRPGINDPNSISNNRINAITEDRFGNLWIGTSNGLNLFSKGTEKFQRIALSSGSNSSNNEIINDLLYDKATNVLWIATKDGVGKLLIDANDPSVRLNLSFEHFTNQKNDSTTIDNNDVTSVLKDKEGFIWAGTAGKFINRYDPESSSFQRVLIDIPNSYELDHIPKVMFIDSDGDFWIGNDLSRLILWERGQDSFKQISPVERNIPIFHIYQDKLGIIWIATDGYGIFLLNKGSGLIRRILHNPVDPFSLPNNQPSEVMQDKDGNFWIATYNKGVSKLAPSKSSFGHYFYRPGNSNSLSTKIAQAVMEDSKMRIWIGTDGGGLNLFNETTNTFRHYRADPGNPLSISSDKILYLLESYDGSIWVCTWDGGLNKFDPGQGKAVQYKHKPSDPFSIGQNTVWCAVEDSVQRLWLGTQTAGLNLFDPRSEKFYKFLNVPGDTTSLISNFVFSIFIDSQNRLLVGTSLGLCVVELNDIEGYIPSQLKFKKIGENGIRGIRINFITEDSRGNVWLGTDLGLHKLTHGLQVERSYSTKDGLPNNLVLGIAEDESGNLWITTKSGLSRLDPETHQFKNFNVHDGLQGMEFQSKSIEKMHDGRIMIGGIDGFNIFNPEDIHLGSGNVQPIITGLRLFNKKINAGDTLHNRVLMSRSIANTDVLELKYNEGYITLEFVALYYQNPERVQYAYRMKGLDQDFIYSGNSRIANYSSLLPGKYTFEVKASVDGSWDEAPVSSVRIIVLPPPWKTWWAYSLYSLVLVSAFWMGMRYYTKVVREEKEHELDQMKLRFFINVSHEFRTPLTLILNPVDKILSSHADPDDVKSSALTIQRSARRLLSLVNQLLDFRKMELGKTPMETVKGDIVKFSRDIFKLFEDMAKSKNIEIHFRKSVGSLPILFDPDKVEKIITNLLSNAIKFTNPGGTVVLSVAKISLAKKNRLSRYLKKENLIDYVEIRVEDTGIGFKKEHLKDVFSRFFHVDNTKTGTGIGLNFTKGLVELHGGEILVESEYGKGSTFIVRLPVDVKANPGSALPKQSREFGNYEFDINAVKSAEYEISITDNEKSPEADDFAKTSSEHGSRPVVLIVEDNRELRVHLKKELKHNFKVREAVNGAEGLQMVTRFYPDIVISDVMMPEMDGFELCRRIKSEIETCHIPVILLTARSLEEDRIEGYKTGADEYLPKPFNISVLRARINNLLEMKKRLREKFAAMGGILPSSEITTNSLDEVFLDKATKVIIDNVGDPDFGLENLLTELGTSRSQFYRKINSLTGQNPSNFIRTIRLKYAAERLTENKYSIKEIAYMAGFNSTAYFSKTFRELFGQTPNEFSEKKIEKTNP